MRADIRRLFVWMTVFFIAMAFLESAVVVYLRALYYPDGFELTLVRMSPLLVHTEVFRELATMIMLLAPGALVARSAIERFAWFCFGFGVWDIFYYVWLKVLLDWPASLMTPDLLFLIPVPWIGPVWAPCMISIGLILLAVLLLKRSSQRSAAPIGTRTWLLLIGGACSMIASFIIVPVSGAFDVDQLMEGHGTIGRVEPMTVDHPWSWLLIGFVMAGVGLWRIHRATLRPG